MENLSREKKIECVLRRALVYCQGMDENEKREEIVKKSIREVVEILKLEEIMK